MNIDKYLYDTDCRMTKKTGNGVGDNIYWEAVSTQALTTNELSDLQKHKGYHPAGYGFYGSAGGLQADGKYKYTWYCSASCD